MKRAMKKVVKKSLAERVEELRDECEAELNRLSEEGRPPGIPAPSIKMMWLARGGSVFEAALVALKEKRNVPAGK